MENKYNCDAYDNGYCYCLGRVLTDEENDRCEEYCCAYDNAEFDKDGCPVDCPCKGDYPNCYCMGIYSEK